MHMMNRVMAAAFNKWLEYHRGREAEVRAGEGMGSVWLLSCCAGPGLDLPAPSLPWLQLELWISCLCIYLFHWSASSLTASPSPSVCLPRIARFIDATTIHASKNGSCS